MSCIYTTFNGHLTKDPVISDTKNGKMASFGVAVNDRSRGETTVIFADVALFGFWAERAEKFLHRGSAIMVTGKINKLSAYNAKDGTPKPSLSIDATGFEFLPGGAAPVANTYTPDKPVNAVNYDAPIVKEDVDDFVNDLPY